MLRTFGVKIFVSDFCEDDAAIQAYCKEDEQKDAEKIPPKAWFVFFPYSMPAGQGWQWLQYTQLPTAASGVNEAIAE